MKNNQKTKRAFVFMVLIAFAISGLFAADIDSIMNGIKEFFSNVQNLMVFLGGCMILFSIGSVILSVLFNKDISPREWKAIIIIFIGGIGLASIGAIVSFLLGDTTANALGITN